MLLALKFAMPLAMILVMILFPSSAHAEEVPHHKHDPALPRTYLDNSAYEKKCRTPELLDRTDLWDLQQWLKKPLGKLDRCYLSPDGVRIVVYSGGFAIFIPPQIWRKFDVQVSRYLNQGEAGASWVADETYSWLNIIIINWNIQVPTLLDYISEDPDVVLAKVTGFVESNFITNPLAQPESPEFSMGSYLDDPDLPRHWRTRRNGNFRLRF